MTVVFFELANLIGSIVMLILMISTIPYILAFLKDIKKAIQYKQEKISFSSIAYFTQFHQRFYQNLNEKQTKRRLLYSGLGSIISKGFSEIFKLSLYGLGIAFIYLVLKETSKSPSVFKNMFESLGIVFISIHLMANIFKAIEKASYLNLIYNSVKWIFVYSLALIGTNLNVENLLKYSFLYWILWLTFTISEKIFIDQVSRQWAYVDINYFEIYWHQDEYSKTIKQSEYDLENVILSEVWSFKYGGTIRISTNYLAYGRRISQKEKMIYLRGVNENDFNR